MGFVAEILHVEPSRQLEHGSKPSEMQRAGLSRSSSCRSHAKKDRLAAVICETGPRARISDAPVPSSACVAVSRRSYRGRSGSEPVDTAQDVNEQASRDRDLGKLESDVSAMADDLGADLDQLLS